MAIFVGGGQTPNIFILNQQPISLAVNFSLLEMLFVVIFVAICDLQTNICIFPFYERVIFGKILIADMDFQKGLNQIQYRMKLDPLGIEFEFSVIIQCTY